MAMSLAPQRLGEPVQTGLREKFGEKMQKMQKGDSSMFEEMLINVGPKFISAATPNYEQQINSDLDAQQLQIKLFVNDVKQREKVPELYSYLKYCTVVPFSKLSSFVKTDVETLASLLLNLKHKTRNLRWRPGNGPLSGKPLSSAEVEFCIIKDLVYVAEFRSARRVSDFFIRNILKLEDLIQDLETIRR